MAKNKGNKDQTDMFGCYEDPSRPPMTNEQLTYYNSYQRAVVYTPKTWAPPHILELCDTTKYEILIRKINMSDNVSEDVKRFLRLAATRFIDFDFSKTADFYACADKPTQELFEELGLVIIDINRAEKAIEDIGAKASSDLKLKAEDAVDELKKAMESDNDADINKAIEKGFVELDHHIMNSCFDEIEEKNRQEDKEEQQ